MSNIAKRVAVPLVAVAMLAATGVATIAPEVHAGPMICDEPKTRYEFTNVTVSSRPSNVKSGYITGPGNLIYSVSQSATVSFTASASVSAEAGVVFAKASATIGTAVTVSRTWTDTFTYQLAVPSGQRRAMQLFQASRTMKVTKQKLQPPCNYVTVYSKQPATAPLKSRQDEWKLVS